MTWNEIYEAADGAACGDDTLKAKDEARHQVRCLAVELGSPDLDNADCPEDAVEDYCNTMKIQFDECGNIVGLELPHWVEDIIYRRKDDAYLEEDLNATAQELAGGNIEISDEQMQRMVAMYRHDEDSNVAMNDTLESVVCRVLGRN